jgi:hypothetical protein
LPIYICKRCKKSVVKNLATSASTKMCTTVTFKLKILFSVILCRTHVQSVPIIYTVSHITGLAASFCHTYTVPPPSIIRTLHEVKFNSTRSSELDHLNFQIPTANCNLSALSFQAVFFFLLADTDRRLKFRTRPDLYSSVFAVCYSIQ